MKKYLISFFLMFFFVINLGSFLDLSHTKKKSDIIVVLGGGKKTRIIEGARLYLNNYSISEFFLFTGTNLYDGVPFFYKKSFLLEEGILEKNIIHFNENKVTNTMEELYEIKLFLLNNNFKSVLFVTHPSHMLRVKLLANIIANYDDENIQISFAPADHTKVWHKYLYFLNFESIKLIFLEYLKIFYNIFKYGIYL